MVRPRKWLTRYSMMCGSLQFVVAEKSATEKISYTMSMRKMLSIRQTGSGYGVITKMAYTLQYYVWKLPINFQDPTVYSC